MYPGTQEQRRHGMAMFRARLYAALPNSPQIKRSLKQSASLRRCSGTMSARFRSDSGKFNFIG